MCKISVIVAAYNAEKTIKRCVDSVLRQTYKDFELIVINDGSKDNTKDLMERLAKEDSRIRFIDKANGGVSSVRNLGLKEARGEYINFVDSDDYIDDDTFEECIKVFEEYDVDAVIYGYYYEQGKKLIPYNVADKLTFYTKEEVLNRIVKGENVSTFMANKMFKRHMFDNITFPVGQIYEDAHRVYYVFNNGEKFAQLPAAKYHWIQNPNSITHLAFSEKKLDEIKALDSMINFFGDDQIELKNIERKHKLKKYEEIIDTMNVLNLENDALYINVTSDFKKYYNELKALALVDDMDNKYYENPGFNKKKAVKAERLARLKAKVKRIVLKAE